MQKEKLTVILGTYKDPDLLINTLDSLINQSIENFHIYVFDDNHNYDKEIIKKSKKIVNSYNDSRLKYIKNDNNIGVPSVYSKWIDYVETEFFYMCGAGDRLYDDSLELMINFLEKNSKASFVHGLEMFKNHDGSFYEINHPPRETGLYDAKNYLKFHLLGGKKNYGWSQCSALYRTELFKYRDMKVEKYHFWDMYFHCSYLAYSEKIGFINKYLTERNVDHSLKTWSKNNVFTNRVERIIQSSNFIKEYEIILLQKKYPLTYYRFIITLRLFRALFFTNNIDEFYITFLTAFKEFISLLIVVPFRIIFYPILLLFNKKK